MISRAVKGIRARRSPSLDGFDVKRLGGFDIQKLRDGFTSQRWQAEMARALVWELTFVEWLEIWLTSGHLAQRGRRKGQYVMARLEDKGAYKTGNVQIILCSENVSQGFEYNEAHGACAPKEMTPSHKAKIAAANRTPEKRAKARANALAQWAKRKDAKHGKGEVSV